METKTPRFFWLAHIPPLVTTLLALAMLEPNNVVGKITAKDWPVYNLKGLSSQ
ncbi:MAG: hypothetical protein WCE68_05600 [Anaerolineales bacterium]